MKKFVAALSLLAILNFGTCSAENVHAVGRGNTERSAIHNAMRAAIERKFGASINSKTRTENHMLLADKVSVDSGLDFKLRNYFKPRRQRDFHCRDKRGA